MYFFRVYVCVRRAFCKSVMCFLNENKTEAFLLRVLIEVGRRATTSKTKQRVCTHHQLYRSSICVCSMLYVKVNAFHHDYTNHLTRRPFI